MTTGKMKLLITEFEDFSQEAIKMLSKKFDVEFLENFSRVHLIDRIHLYDVIFIRLGIYIDKEIIEKGTRLKYILTATTGLDHIDVDFFEERGGKVISLKDEVAFLSSIPSTAEHTWGLLLSLVKKIPSSFDSIKEGVWNRNLHKGNNLKGKKLGILGLGRVGVQVAKFAQAFDMEVGYYDSQKKETNLVGFNSAEALFKWAEIVSIHLPLNKNNFHFIDKSLLDQLSKQSILINTSRGAIVDESYLCFLLKEKKIKGYATDVLENELTIDFSNNELIGLAKAGYNVLITPHIAGATFESMKMTEDFVVEKFLKIIFE